MQGDRALWCYSVQRSYASEREASIGHGCVPALICFSSNLHVTGFSSWGITTMIHSYLVCVCVSVCSPSPLHTVAPSASVCSVPPMLVLVADHRIKPPSLLVPPGRPTVLDHGGWAPSRTTIFQMQSPSSEYLFLDSYPFIYIPPSICVCIYILIYLSICRFI